MEKNHTYLTISNPSEVILTDSGSRFIAFSVQVGNEEDVRNFLTLKRREFPDATHHCYSWVLNDGQKFRINDDGEPSGSAGKPIYNEIRRRGLTNVLVLVVRYFGGKKLGIPGLINAYGHVTHLCLEASGTLEKVRRAVFRIHCHPAESYQVYNMARKFDAEVKTSPEMPDELILTIVQSKKEAFDLEMKNNFIFETVYLGTE